jgi:hypothetical protein
MRLELERSLRKAELGKYIIQAAKADPTIAATLETAYQQGVMQERERHLAIDRAGGPDAFKAAELLASTMQRMRKGQ